MDLFQTIGKGVESVMDSVTDLGHRMKYEAKQATGNSRIKLKLIEEQNRLKTLFAELGESYYNDVSGKVDDNPRPTSEVVQEISEVKESILGLENSLRFRKFKEESNDDNEKRCRYCNEILREEDQFCSHCGTSVEEPTEFDEGIIVDEVEVLTKMCPNCGQQMSVHSKYCSRCGLSMEKY